jgi:RNA polymerase sigma-70 factor (ECF subfamily)
MSVEIAAYLSNPLPDAAEKHSPVSTSPVETSNANEAAGAARSSESFAEQESDETLLSKIGEGNREALSIIFRRHARSVFYVARRILRDEAEAEDMIQEVFIYLFQNAGSFDRSKCSATSWIFQMAYHRSIDRRRYLTFRQHYHSKDFDEERQPINRGNISIDELAGRALLDKLREELSEDQMQALELHIFEGYTFHEIAERTGKEFGTIRHHYYRALQRLRSFVFPGKIRSK